MNKYRVVRIPTPCSRLDNPSVRLLARKLLFRLQRPEFLSSPAILHVLVELRNRLNDVIAESECT